MIYLGIGLKSYYIPFLKIADEMYKNVVFFQNLVNFLLPRYDLSKPNTAILIMGDMQGGLGVIEFDKALVFLFGPQIGCNRVLTFKDIIERRVLGAIWTYYSKVSIPTENDVTVRIYLLPLIYFILLCIVAGKVTSLDFHVLVAYGLGD